MLKIQTQICGIFFYLLRHQHGPYWFWSGQTNHLSVTARCQLWRKHCHSFPKTATKISFSIKLKLESVSCSRSTFCFLSVENIITSQQSISQILLQILYWVHSIIWQRLSGGCTREGSYIISVKLKVEKKHMKLKFSIKEIVIHATFQYLHLAVFLDWDRYFCLRLYVWSI